MTTTHSATATRDGRWWLIEVDGVGATQAKNLTEAKGMAADLVAAMLDIDEDDIEIDLTITLDQQLQEYVQQAKDSLELATWIRDRAAHLSRWATWELTSVAGFTGRDAAVILDVTPQRVSQLLADQSAIEVESPETTESIERTEELVKAFKQLVGH